MHPTRVAAVLGLVIFGITLLREDDCTAALTQLEDEYYKKESQILAEGAQHLGEAHKLSNVHKDVSSAKVDTGDTAGTTTDTTGGTDTTGETDTTGTSGTAGQTAEERFAADMTQKWRASAGLYKDKTLHEEFSNVVMVTMVNAAYEAMFNNWKCQTDKFGLDFMVLAFDTKTVEFMGEEKTVVLPGSETEEQIRVNTNRFNVLGCQKVDAVIKLLELGADVIVVDADCVFRREPLEFFTEALKYDFYFQSNHPGCQHRDPTDPHPACFLLNSGFYYVTARNKVIIDMLRKAQRSCYDSADVKNVSPTDGAGDQRALQRMLNDELNIPTHYFGKWDSTLSKVPKPWKRSYTLKGSFFKSAAYCMKGEATGLPEPVLHYCTLDPHVYPAGKHKAINEDEMVLFHANHLPGGIKAKIGQLRKFGLWNGGVKCE